MATVNVAYAASASITLTAPATGTARECTAVDNTTNKYDDALVRVNFTAGTVSGNKQVVIYAYGSEDGTNYESVVTGTDANITLRSPESLPVMKVIPVPTSSVGYKVTFNVAQCYGGVLPRKWGLVFLDDTAGGVSSLAVSYTGITYTVA
jgi:hypothetical protein